MKKKSQLHDYQIQMVNHISQGNNSLGLFADMGMGKTATTLTIISELLSSKKAKKILLVAPIRVCKNTWIQESKQWEHTGHIKFSLCVGDLKSRKKGLEEKADVYLINRESMLWLMDNHLFDFDTLIIDESSSFKNPTGKTFKRLKYFLKNIKYRIILTGTPAPNSLMDLWSQVYILDRGLRLGPNITTYKRKYFDSVGYMGYQLKAKPGAFESIMNSVKDICYSLKASDYLTMVDRVDICETVNIDRNKMEIYKKFEKEFILKTIDSEIQSTNAAGLQNKLLQFCNGAVYDEEGKWHEVHDEKIKALREIIEDNPDENFLVAYNFKSDLSRLKSAFPEAVVLDKNIETISDWNLGLTRILIANPASAAHGLNLQFGGRVVVWFGLTWNLELYQQFNARLYRQGQKRAVRIIHLVMKKGIDEKIVKALENKAKNQNELMEFLKMDFL